MASFTEVLVYAGWGAAPVVAYQALMHGLNRAGRGFLAIFAVYSAAVIVTALAVRADLARAGFGAVSPVGVLLPWLGTGVLSAALFALGRKAGGSAR
ncbi:hypothetical protein [Actibacterium sp. D379-3]